MLDRVTDAVDGAEHLGHQRLFHGAMSEVRVDRLGDRVRVLAEHAVELAQILRRSSSDGEGWAR